MSNRRPPNAGSTKSQNEHHKTCTFSSELPCRRSPQCKDQTSCTARLGERSLDGRFFVNTHIEKCNPILQKAWYLLQFAVRAQKEQKEEYIGLFWEAIDAYYIEIAKFEGFQCGSGCSHCCFDNPHGVSSMEAYRIVPRLSTHQRDLLKAYFQEWNLHREKNPLQRQLAWKKKCKPCPLLSEGKCSVYDVRPLACRSFFSVRHPDWCHPLHPNHHKQPQIGHDDIHSLLERLSIQYGWGTSQDLISGLHHHITEDYP